MKKGVTIGLSIIVLMMVVATILFGAVFCLRNQSVKIVGESVSASNHEIIVTAGFKKNKSIFALDKAKAIKNIEKRYPNIKVIQIRTINLSSIEICVRARHEMFYIKANEKYYIIDEELKVLNISSSEPIGLTKITSESISVGENAQKSDFLGTDEQRKTFYNLFVAMNTVVTTHNGTEDVYLTRDDIKSMIKEVNLKKFETFDKTILKTQYGVELDIESLSINSQNKINICFSTIKKFIKDGNNKEKGGTIKIFNDIDNELKCVYIP